MFAEAAKGRRAGSHTLRAEAALIVVLASMLSIGRCESKKGEDPCDRVVTMVFYPKMFFGPVSSKNVRPRNPVAKMTIREDGSVSKVELVRSSNVKAWDDEILDKMKTARYSEARGCGERTSEIHIRIDYAR
jgi:hypothetical protein